VKGQSVASPGSDKKLSLTRIVGDFGVFGIQTIQERCENGGQAIPSNLIAAPPALCPLLEVDSEDGTPFLVRDGLEYMRFWTEWTGPIPLNERLEVRIRVIRADEGRGSVCRRVVTLVEVSN